MRQIGMQLGVLRHSEILGGDRWAGRYDGPHRQTAQSVEDVLQNPLLARKKVLLRLTKIRGLPVGLFRRSRGAPARQGR